MQFWILHIFCSQANIYQNCMKYRTQRAPIWAFWFAENVSESRIVVQNSLLLDMVRGHVSASTLVFFSKLHTTTIFRLTFLRLKSLMIHVLSKTWFALFSSTYIPWQMVYFSVYQQKKRKLFLTNPLRQNHDVDLNMVITNN